MPSQSGGPANAIGKDENQIKNTSPLIETRTRFLRNLQTQLIDLKAPFLHTKIETHDTGSLNLTLKIRLMQQQLTRRTFTTQHSPPLHR